MKQVYAILLLLLSLTGYSQFDEDVPSIQLYNEAVDLHTYIQMVGKSKLYIINNVQKELANKELDYALAKINENINDIDVNEENSKIRRHIKNIKSFWQKFSEKATAPQGVKEYTAFYYQINTFDKLISNLVESMLVNYNLPSEKINNYLQVQKLRAMIQKITISYFANHLGLSKSFLHQYKKNISETDEFIKNNSNTFLNDPIAGKYYSEIITDWNFFRSNILHQSMSTPKTVFVLSTSLDYRLSKIKDSYIDSFKNEF